MSVLTCEICGGKLIGKPGGIFECDFCGMEYSVEWAKSKIQEINGTVKVEGTVDTQGKVKEDDSVQVKNGITKENLVKHGFMLLNENPYLVLIKKKEIASYFDRALEIDQKYAEAYLGKVCLAQREPDYTKLGRFWDNNAKEERYNIDFLEDLNYKKALQFADNSLKAKLNAITQEVEVLFKAQEQKKQQKQDEKKKAVEPEIECFRKRMPALRQRIEPALNMISVGQHHIVTMDAEGMIRASLERFYHSISLEWYYNSSNNYGQTNVLAWDRNFTAVAAGYYHTIGLKDDGTVVATGNIEYGQCDVSKWKDIVAISSGDNYSVGLRVDGTVVSTGIRSMNKEVSEWRDIIAISAGSLTIVGLKKDGTVVVAGENNYGQRNTLGWYDIIAVAAGAYQTFGLKANGTVIATEYTGRYKHSLELDVSQWREIIAIATYDNFIAGIKADGTLITKGKIDFNKKYKREKWGNLVAISVRGNYLVGLKSTGEILVACRELNDKLDLQPPVALLFENYSRRYLEKTEEMIKKAKEKRNAVQHEIDILHGPFAGKRRKELQAEQKKVEAELEQLNDILSYKKQL